MTHVLYAAAAIAEIAGCFSFGACWWLAKSPLWLAQGVRPDRWDMIGAAIRRFGASVIRLARRGA